MGCDWYQARNFLWLIHGRLRQGLWIAFGVKREGEKAVRQFFARPGTLPAFPGTAGCHVWVTPCAFRERCRKKVSAAWVPALWADLDPPDGGDLEVWRAEALRDLEALDPAPSLIVDSGRGWHVYFLLTEPVRVTGETLAQAEAANRGIRARVSGGDSVPDLSRFLRLPGTVNPKNGRPCRLVRGPGPAYSFEALVKVFAAEPVSSCPAPRRTVRIPCLPARPGAEGKRKRGRPRLGVTVRDLRGLPEWTRRLIVAGGFSFRERYPKVRRDRRDVSGCVVAWDRSRADMAVVGALARAGWDVEGIAAVFRRRDWGIGDRYRDLLTREGPARADKYLALTIGKALEAVRRGPERK